MEKVELSNHPILIMTSLIYVNEHWLTRVTPFESMRSMMLPFRNILQNQNNYESYRHLLTNVYIFKFLM